MIRAAARSLCALLLLTAAACGTAGTSPAPAPARAASGEVQVENGKLYYEVAGNGPAVVLLHGGFGDLRMWNDQFRDLAQDFRVVRYDFRGFGRSPAPQAEYSAAEDLVRLLDHLGIERAHLVGNSMGGTLAIDFALLRPERTGKAVILASGAKGYPSKPEDIQSVVDVFVAAQEHGTDRAAELWLQHPMVAVTSQDPGTAPLLRTMIQDNRDIFLMSFSHWPSAKLEPPAFQRLGEIRVPMLFLVGDRDTPQVRKIAEDTARGIAGARLEVLTGADHLPQMVLPDEVTRRVREFLQAPS